MSEWVFIGIDPNPRALGVLSQELNFDCSMDLPTVFDDTLTSPHLKRTLMISESFVLNTAAFLICGIRSALLATYLCFFWKGGCPRYTRSIITSFTVLFSCFNRSGLRATLQSGLAVSSAEVMQRFVNTEVATDNFFDVGAAGLSLYKYTS